MAQYDLKGDVCQNEKLATTLHGYADLGAVISRRSHIIVMAILQVAFCSEVAARLRREVLGGCIVQALAGNRINRRIFSRNWTRLTV